MVVLPRDSGVRARSPFSSVYAPQMTSSWDRPMPRLTVLVLALGIATCGSDPAPVGNDAAVLRLECPTPLSTPLVPLVGGTTPGVPTMGIAWVDGRCAFVTDEADPNLVLYIADFTGTTLRYLIAARAGRWQIASSSTEPGPTTYLSMLPRDTDISVVMERSGVNVMITFRLEGTTLILVAMRLA